VGANRAIFLSKSEPPADFVGASLLGADVSQFKSSNPKTTIIAMLISGLIGVLSFFGSLSGRFLNLNSTKNSGCRRA